MTGLAHKTVRQTGSCSPMMTKLHFTIDFGFIFERNLAENGLKTDVHVHVHTLLLRKDYPFCQEYSSDGAIPQAPISPSYMYASVCPSPPTPQAEHRALALFENKVAN